ncbi:uncharacterized protein LOC128883004 [Hylaeus volcanicus]|uniref:uncharacterized protein LOC128883004 n=1 Tax=Hylaeus volcanicus TaxID=313075 RepID=UPI0023B83720|nr:uncharacterized protein LOC128883004 [Hylaeus volcanicus]XP_053990916.1 uncharacterized protein LOC128883004 [Hylaeus volcanicus]XP_053990917.1 uncharacterized protein LOC128883004 [Hylaeus volcanicus]XP_053990918.1 uncharacterized protein LOC128883004 [Hylaeus volcanicus]XP_053990919.1 uncharacterized protein LOC128883004 [Hylaeus volcanicus]
MSTPQDKKFSELGKGLIHFNSNQRKKYLKQVEELLSHKAKDFDHEDFFKLWIVLFFALWNADGPQASQELSLTFSKLLYKVPKKSIGVWMDAFWFTLQKEWNKLDKYRVEKFQLLIRLFLTETFLFLRQNQWDSKMIEFATSSWVYGPINGVQTTNVVGVVYQLIDVFMEVLRPIAENDKNFTPSTLLLLIHDFILALVKGSHSGVAEKVHMQIIGKLKAENENEVEQVAKCLFRYGSLGEKGVRIKRVFRSIEVLDKALSKVNKKVDYEHLIEDIRSKSIGIKENLTSEQMKASSQQCKKTKNKRLRKIKRHVRLTYCTRRRRIFKRQASTKL